MRLSATATRVILPSLATALVFYLMWSGPRPVELEPASDDPDTEQRLSVRWVQPVEVRPGDAVIAEVDGVDSSDALSARFSTQQGKSNAKILRRDESRIVIQVPRDLATGVAKLRVYQSDRKSKPRLLQVRPMSLSDLLRSALGGLAFLIVGLSLVARAFRHSADQRLRNHLTTMTQNSVRSAGLGAMIGALSQSTTGSAGIMVGMLRARLIHGHAALAVLLGAQLGAATAGALLPLFASRQALWIVALGVLWTFAAGSRWARALGQIVLGCGVLFLGLAFMQEGLRPLLSEPALAPVVASLAGAQGATLLLSVALGALLAALLQGPGPAFAVIAALAQSSSLLSLTESLYILAGCGLGSSLGTLIVGVPIGYKGRRLALGHVVLGLVSLLVTMLGASLFGGVASMLLDTSAETVRYGVRVLRPHMASHLGLAFVFSQGVSAALCLLLLPSIERLLSRLVRGSAQTHDAHQVPSLRPVLTACRVAILSLGKVVQTRDRAYAVEAERAIGEARGAVTSLLNQLSDDGELKNGAITMGNLTACLHLSTATDGALRVAERALESDLSMHDVGATQLAQIQALLVEGIESLVAYAEGEKTLNLEEVQAREIRLNALEAQARTANATASALPAALWVSELSSACEAIGNHIYRLANALMSQRAQTLSSLTPTPPPT